MGFVDHRQIVSREIVQQTRGPLAGQPTRKRSGVVLDTRAGADLEQHVDVEVGPGFEPLRLEQLASRPELGEPRREFLSDEPDRPLHHRPLGDILGGGPDGTLLQLGDRLAGDRMDLRDPLDRVAPQLDPDSLLLVGREDLDRIAADPEGAGIEGHVVPVVLDGHQIRQNGVPSPLCPARQREHVAAVGGGIAEAVDGADRGDDDHVVPLHQARGGAEPERLDVLVDRRVLFDVEIGRGHVRFGLVVVVVGDEVLDRVVGQELLEFAVELSGQRLVVGKDQRWLPVVGDGMGQRHGLAGPGDAEQGLVLVATNEAGGQRRDGRGLIAGRSERGVDLEARHQTGKAISAFLRGPAPPNLIMTSSRSASNGRPAPASPTDAVPGPTPSRQTGRLP